MSFLRCNSVRFLTALALSSTLAGCSSPESAAGDAASTAPSRGGTIRYATNGNPSTLDMMKTTLVLSSEITSNIYEGLFALDSLSTPRPSLAESYEVNDAGLVWVIALRRGVSFHNGQELTSDDVVASLKRWGVMTQSGRVLFQELAGLKALDKYRVGIRLNRPLPVIPNLLTVPQGMAAIYPKSVIEAAGSGDLKEFVGTGPIGSRNGSRGSIWNWSGSRITSPGPNRRTAWRDGVMRTQTRFASSPFLKCNSASRVCRRGRTISL